MGAGAGFSCCCSCRTPELSLQTLGLSHQAGGLGHLRCRAVLSLGPPGPSSAGGAGGYQRLSSPLRGPHLTPQGISPWKVCAPEKKELPPPWWSPGAAFETPSVSGPMREAEA